MFATEMNRMRKIQNAVTLSLTAMFCLFTPSSAFAITPTTLTPTSVNFGNVVIHESSAIKLVTLKNNQSVALNIASMVLSPGSPYAIDPSSTCPSSGSLAPSGTPGASCTIGLTLTPAALGTQPAGSVTITTNASNSPQTITLSGKGIAPVAISPTSLKLTFAAQLEGTTSAGQTVKVSNQQNIPLNISGVSVSGANSGDFGVTNSCPTVPSSVPATASCTLSVTFTPTASGARTATLSIIDDASSSPQVVTLTGSGSAPVTLTPVSITTFSALVGTTSAFKTVTIKNSATTPLTLDSFQFSGDFEQTATTCGTLPKALAPGASCNVSVTFDPTIGGVRDGQLLVYDSALSSPQVVNLSGKGTSPLTVSPATLSFSALLVGTESAAKTITLTNHESESETFSLALTSGLSAIDFLANSNCSTGVIAANSSCLIYVNFAPSSTSPTTRTGTLTVTDSAPGGSPLTASLTGSATATNPAAAVAVVSPGAGAAGTTVPVTITGNGWTHFSSSSVISFTDTTSASNPSDITVSGVTAVSPNVLNATLTLTGGTGAIYGARNIKVVTPLSGGASETAKLTSAFIIGDPSNTHLITAVSPAFGIQGQSLAVGLTATGTSFVQGTTFANFGSGITVNSLTITDATDAVANITISNTTTVGYRTITLATGEEIATSVLSPSGNPIFQIGPNSAALVSVSPNSAAQGTNVPAPGMTITASGTHFLQNATQVAMGGGVLVGDVTVTSPTTAVAQVAVPANATVGLQNVTVSTGGEIATLGNAFAVTGATPALLSVVPSSAAQGQTLNVVITGNAYTSFSQSAIQAEFTGEIAVNSITVNSPNSVTVNITVSQNANVGSITANLTSGPSGGATIFPFTFTVTPSSAQIVSVTPNSVPQGGQVQLAVVGLNTHWNQSTTTAVFPPIPYGSIAVNEITITDATHATLNVSVPVKEATGSNPFYMATGGEVVYSSVTVYANTPSLTMSPANGLIGTTFSASFTGQFTHFTQAGTLPVVAGQGVTLTNFTVNSLVSATATVTISPTAATTSRLVTFTTGGEIVTTYLNVTSTPVGIISITPYHAPQSTTLNVEIVGLNTHFTAGTTQVLFGPQITVNSITVNTLTDLTANITTSYLDGGVLTASPSGWQSVYVNTGAEQVIAGFAVDAPASPTLVGVVPSSAAQGSTVDVTITGSSTNWVEGQTEAILGAGVTVANLSITGPTTATATISVAPTAPVGGNSVIMITGSEIVSGTGFSVTPSAAEIVSVSPAIACNGNFVTYCGGSGSGGTPWVVSQLQTATLNIAGVGTHWLQGETTVSFGPGVVVDSLTVTSALTATVQITVLSSAPVGFATLTTYTGGEIVTLLQAIDIEEGFPALLGISPAAAQQGGNVTLQVLGRFTNWQQGVTSLAFNQDITVNSVSVIDSDSLTASITVSPWAYIDYASPCGHVLTVTTGSQQVSTAPILDNFCVVQGVAQIDSISSLSGFQGSTETVTITGGDTHFLQGVTTVSFGDPNFQVGTVTVTSPTTLSAPVAIATTATPGYKTVTVATYGEIASQQYSFTVIPDVPTLNEAIPNQAEQGAQHLSVELIGQYSNWSALSTATFGAGITVNSVADTDATHLTANLSIDPLSFTGSRLVTVTTPGVPCSVLAITNNPCQPGATTGSEIDSLNAFTIIPGPAIISSVSPATGNEGQEVVVNLTGSATHWQQNFTQFYIAGGGYDLTINSVVINSPTSATVDLSISPTANPGARSIYMVTNGESLTDSGAFVVTGGVPVITYLSPNSGQPGANQEEVVINGLYTQWVQGTTTVNFGPGVTVTSFQVDDATHIEAVINIDPAAQLGYRTVVVQTGTQGLTSNFLVQAPPPPPTPFIWYESPSSGLPGQTFTITFEGSNTSWNPDPISGTRLTGFNSSITLNTFQVTGPTTALANITIAAGASASTSDLTLTTGAEVENAQFSVVIAQPTLNIVDPGTGMQGAQNLTVNILGQFTNFDSTTTFNFGSGVTVNGPPTILGPGIATQSISVGQLATLGGRSVVATTEGTAVGGAGFSVTASLALISAVTPNLAPQNASLAIDVTGQNTHWDGSTVFTFGAGIVVSNVSVNSSTDATMTLTVPALAPLGTTYATAQTGGEIASIAHAFVVEAGTPLLLSSGPGALPQQSSAVFTILSQATNWSALNPPTVSFGPGIVLTNVIVTSTTSMTVQGFVQPTTTVGPRNLLVGSGTQVLGLSNAVYVTAGPAAINSVTPSTGGQGQTLPAVQINGTNTNWQQGVTQLTFPGVLINSFTVNSANSITANITVSDYAAAGQVSVTATTLGEVATGVNVFTITQTQPELLAVVPSSGAQGVVETVNLTGQFTNFVNGTTTASFGAGITVNSVTVSSATAAQANITVQPTAALGYRSVSVTTGTQVVSLTNAFQVTTGPAAILSLNPASGGQGTSLALAVTGSQTNFASGITTAAFGGGISVTGISVTDALHATVNISIPNSTPLGAYDVSLTTGGEVATILGGFTVTGGGAQLSVVSPPTGTQGTTFNVNLTGVFTSFVNGTSVANFGSGVTVNSTTVSSSTAAVANITISQTAAIGSRNVSVTTGSQVASITGGFSVLAGVPTLLTASPAFAQAGSTTNVVITGEFTSFAQGSSSVTFGSGVTVNSVTVSSATQLTANISVASNASVGARDITVTTGGQTETLSSGFAVTAGTSVVTQIDPNIGNPGAAVTVALTGQYTNWVNGTTTVSFGPGITVGAVTVSDATDLSAAITISSGAALGPVDVVVTTGAEVESVPGGFTVQAAVVPAPTVISLSPPPNSGGMPINSNIIAVFSQPMDRSTINTGTVLLYLTTNPQGSVPVSGTVNLDATGRVMTFIPSALLAVNSGYSLEMTSSIQDATGNAFSYYAPSFNTVFTANTTPATVIAANPPANGTAVGTNVAVQLEFSTDMNQSTQAGLTVSTGGTNVPGSFSWNSTACYYCYGGPGTILTFTPNAPLQAGTTYTVSYGTPLADTAGNALTAGSFPFTTGSGADTAYNATGLAFNDDQTNLGTNFVPQVIFNKPINPIDVNTGTLLLYDGDSGKYIFGTVNVAANGLSATFTPSIPLLPYTYYRIHMSGGYYDMDGNYLYGIDGYFTTGAGSVLTPPQVSSVFPTSGSTTVPLNANVVVHFNEAINPTGNNTIQVTPTAGGSPVAGTNSLSGDQLSVTFTPTDVLQGNTQYTVQVSGYTDLEGNAGGNFSSNFTTSTSVAPIVVSTGVDASDNLITTGDTIDPHWFVNGTSTNAEVVAATNADWWSPWVANGPSSSWIAPNPDVVAFTAGNTLTTTFHWSGSTTNLCLVGDWGSDGYGTLELNGQTLLNNVLGFSSLTPFNVSIATSLIAGTNTLTQVWNSAYSGHTGFRLQASIQTCGASQTGGLTLTSANPPNGTSNVATNTTVTLNFNNPLDPATVSSNTLPVMVNWNGNQVLAGTYVVAGNQVTFTPDSPFPINTTIWVGACNGPYDIAGDSAGNCYTQLTSFVTNSTVTPPSGAFQVTAFSPSAGSTSVGLRTPVVATFNRSFNAGTLNSADFALFNGDSQGPWCTSYSRSQDNSTLQFNCYPLLDSSTLTAYLNNGIQDWSGNALISFSSQFSTTQYDSSTNGSVISVRPGTGSGGISVNSPLVIFTSLPINPGSATGGLQVAQNNVAISGTVQVLDNGYTLEFTPGSPFTPGALIQWWTTGTLTDATYNNSINAASGYFYVAASTASETPTVQVASPAAYSSPVAVNTVFDIQFNTPLNPATVTNSNIYLYDSSTGLDVTGTYTMPQPNEVRIVPTGNLSANTYIYVYITAGLQSSTSVPATATSWYEFTGSPVDTTLPTVVSAVPYNGSTNIGVNVQPGVVFSKTIDPVSVNSNTFQVTSGGTPLTGSYWFSSTDTRVEFVPNAPLPVSANLVMTLNGVLDQVGNPVSFTSHFKTAPGPDFTQPTVVSSSVTTGGSIPTNSSITTQFSESMDVTTFSASNFRIYDTLQGTNVAATLSWSADQSVAYLVPTSPLAAGREYYLYVNTGTDLAGNQMQSFFADFYAEFSSSTTAPTVTSFNPLSGATEVGTNVIIEAQFSAPIDPNTIGGVTLSKGGTPVLGSSSMGAGNTALEFSPLTPLAPNSSYTLAIVGVKDPAGNAVATVTNSFSTGATFDISAPTVVNYDPPYNSTVGTNVVPKMVFNKALNPLTVANSTFRMFLADTGQFIPLTVTLSTNGLEVTMAPQIPLLPSTHYHFQACCGYQDQDGNVGGQTDLYFYTSSGADTTGPTVTVSPLTGATGIPLNAQVIVSVSTNIDATTWSQSSIQLLNGGTSVAGTVSQLDNQTLAFAPTSLLSAGITYTVKVNGFSDANGNAVGPFTSTFTTGSAASAGGLTLVSTNIPNGATGVSVTSPIIFTFSQTLDPATVNTGTMLVMNGWNGNYGLAGTYAVSGAQVTFTPTSPYPPGATVYVGACGGPTDVLGDVYQNGGCYVQLLEFAVVTGSPDTGPLQVVSVYPASGATGVRPDVSVSVTFNKSINPYSVYDNNNNALLFAGQGLQDHGSISMSADNRTLTFSSGTLSTATDYTIELPAGGIADPSGVALASLFTSTFTTGTNPATGSGSVSASPGPGATGVPTDSLLTLYANRAVDAATLPGNLLVTVNGSVYAGTVTSTASGYEIEFTPSSPFPDGATVQWFFSGSVLDVNGDAFSANSGTFYTVAAVNPATEVPTLVGTSPACCTENYNVPTNAEIDLEYSVPIDPTTLSGVYFNSGSTPATFELVPGSPNVVRVIPSAPLTPSTFYGLCNDGTLMGANGVAAANQCYATYFTTSTGPDTTPGKVTIGPPNSSVNVGTNAYIRLVFSKPVDVTTITSTSVTIRNGSTPIPGTWSYAYSSGDIVGAYFSPDNPLPPSATISVSASNLLDYAGNTFPTATAHFATAALPDYTTPTATLDFPSATTGIATNASFTCLYSEPMDPSSITSAGTYVYSYTTGARVPVTYTFASDLLSATMTPTSALTPSAQFYYDCSGAIDLTGNGQSGASAYFYTGTGPSTTGPTLVQVNPPNGFTNVPVNINSGYGGLDLLFSEPIAQNSLGSITLTPSGGSRLAISFSPGIGNTQLWVQLPSSLLPNTTYTYDITGVTDYTGNAITPVTRTFTTGSSFDWNSPTVTAVTPANGATAVNDTTPGLSVVFSEAMDPVLMDANHIYLRTHNTQTTVPTTFTMSADYTTVYLTPVSPLSAATIYDVVTAAPNWYLTDITGNPYSPTGVISTFTSQ